MRRIKTATLSAIMSSCDSTGKKLGRSASP